MMIPAGPDNKKARKKAGNKHEGNSNVGDDRKYPGWVWCWLTESNRRHPAYKAGALPAELNQQSGGTGRIRTFDHSVNSRTHNRCASDPEMKKPKALTSGLNFFASERLNGFPALEMNLTSFSGNCNIHFPQKHIFIEKTHHLVTRERMTSAYDSCL